METLIYYYDTGDKKYLVYAILLQEGETLSQGEVNALLVGKIGLNTEKRKDVKIFKDLDKYSLMKTTQFILKSESPEIKNFVDSCPVGTIICSFWETRGRTIIMPL